MARPGIRWWGGAAVAVLLLSGCGGRVHDAGGVAVLVSEYSTSGMDALSGGALTVIDGCLGVGDAVVLWPFGTSVVSDDPLMIDVPDHGTYTLGDEVAVGGGYVYEGDGPQGNRPTAVAGVTLPTSCADNDLFLAH